MTSGAGYNPVPSPMGAGCSIPGTDNPGTDSDSYVGIWGISTANYVIGNRVSNYFHGIFFELQRNGGQGFAENKVCASHQRLIGFEGNTIHGFQGFGTYLNDNVSPRHGISQTIASNGFVEDLAGTCDVTWLDDGEDNGFPMKVSNNVDHGGVFVGGYSSADLQFRRHVSIDVNNGIYWKNTKNFADGCSAHLLDGFYRDTHLALPDAAAFIIEVTHFEGRVDLESGHHCDALCFGQYMLVNSTWNVHDVNRPWFQFPPERHHFGGVFSLSPPEVRSGNPTANLFPQGYSSLVHRHYEFLLDIEGSGCSLARDVMVPDMTAELMAERYLDGVLCQRDLRVLKIRARAPSPDMKLLMEVRHIGDNEVLSRFTMTLNDANEAFPCFAMPVVLGSEYEYFLTLLSGNDEAIAMPTDWIIEFSEDVFANRWGADYLNLHVYGRDCDGDVVSSRHDRRFLFADMGQKDERAWGHGACTAHPEMPEKSCRQQTGPSSTLPAADNDDDAESVDIIPDFECDGECSENCGDNGFCECGSKQCVCRPGFAGAHCEIDLCSMAGCDAEHGQCSATYLGSSLPVTARECVCELTWLGR